MLRQSITHCVEKPPWRIHVPITGRTVEMGDIVHVVLGASALILLALPLLFLFGPTVLIIFGFVGAVCGVFLRRWTSEGVGWRIFVGAFISYEICRKKARRAGSREDHKGVVYMNMWSPPPLFAEMASKKHVEWTPRHIAVGKNYEVRPDPRS